MTLAIVHRMTDNITRYELVVWSTDNSRRPALIHKKYGRYPCTPRMQLCYEDGELWNLPHITVEEVNQEVENKLLESPDHCVYQVGGSFYNELHEAQQVTT